MSHDDQMMKHWINLALPQENSDPRFKDNFWKEHPWFNTLKQNYLVSANKISSVLSSLDGADEHTIKQIHFYIQQWIDAMAPSNFVATNPNVLHETFNTNGENILKGFQNFIADLERNHGKFQIQMTDSDFFKIGENIAITTGKVIFQNELMQLIQYQAKTKTVYQRPLLIIPPWVNKFYILDLSPENSFVNWLIHQGYTVFMISWINPDQSHAHKNFENYMLEGPIAALDVIKKATGESKVNAVGYCIGGTLLSCTLAYLAAHNNNQMMSGTYLTTMLDFSEPGELGIFIDENQISSLEIYMKKQGYLDGKTLAQVFNALRANDLIWSYYIKNYLQGQKPKPMDILYWNSDSTNLPETMQSFYLRQMYLNNLLIKPNQITLADVSIDLTKIDVPVYFFSTEKDHIAPWKSTYSGLKYHSGEKTFVLGGSGHIAGVINPPDKNKYHYYTHSFLQTSPEDFLEKSEKNAGSWWLHWEKWVRQYSGEQIKARKIGSKTLPVIEDAPGSFVKMKCD